jgi:hypothetical protein
MRPNLIPLFKEFGVEKLYMILPDKFEDRWLMRCVMGFELVYDPNWATLLRTNPPYMLLLDPKCRVDPNSREYGAQYLFDKSLTRKHAIDMLRSACKNVAYFRYDWTIGYDAGIVSIRGMAPEAITVEARIMRQVQTYIDHLVQEEALEMRRNAMAKKIQKRFRRVVAEPAFAVCKRRLLREFGELQASAERA